MTSDQMLGRKYAMQNEYPRADLCPVCMTRMHGRPECSHCKQVWQRDDTEQAELDAALGAFRDKWFRDPTATVEEVQMREMAREQQEEPTRPVSPPLMIFAERKMSCDDQAQFGQAWKSANFIIITPGFTVFQLVDGRWQQIKPEPKGE